MHICGGNDHGAWHVQCVDVKYVYLSFWKNSLIFFLCFFFWFLSPFRDRLHVQQNFGGIGSYTEGSFTGEIKDS